MPDLKPGDRVTAPEWLGGVKTVERIELRYGDPFAIFCDEDGNPDTDSGWWPVDRLSLVDKG